METGIMRTCFRISVVFMLLCTGCTSFTVPGPAGFAEYPVKKGVYRAITSDGVRLRVYRIKNEPFGDASMWNASAALYLKKKGYREKNSVPVTAGSGIKGTLSEYLYHYYGKDYVYALALFTDRSYLYIIEAGGTQKEYGKKRESLVSAIRGFSVK